MDTSYLVKNFISHASKFYGDSMLPNIDVKHSEIVDNAYKTIKGIGLDNLRNWSAQGDMGAPAQVSFRRGLLKGLARPLYKKLFRQNSEALLRQALYDDLHLIKSINAEQLLTENPVHLTPGVGDYYTVGQLSVNYRWLRYIYLAKRIIDLNALSNGGIWVDIGSFYGGLQGIVRKYNPKARMVLVDFHHQLCRSYIYLSCLYPEATHVLPDQVFDYNSLDMTPEGSIIYVPSTNFEAISQHRVDLTTNFFSFGEMTRSTFEMYFDSNIVLKSGNLLLVNRFISSPYFEPTYNTDLTVLDYLISNRKTKYFDVFPMHHYMSVDRDLFGRRGPRNISSSYFELLSIID